jgi:hypothetical protein
MILEWGEIGDGHVTQAGGIEAEGHFDKENDRIKSQ